VGAGVASGIAGESVAGNAAQTRAREDCDSPATMVPFSNIANHAM